MLMIPTITPTMPPSSVSSGWSMPKAMSVPRPRRRSRWRWRGNSFSNGTMRQNSTGISNTEPRSITSAVASNASAMGRRTHGVARCARSGGGGTGTALAPGTGGAKGVRSAVMRSTRNTTTLAVIGRAADIALHPLGEDYWGRATVCDETAEGLTSTAFETASVAWERWEAIRP